MFTNKGEMQQIQTALILLQVKDFINQMIILLNAATCLFLFLKTVYTLIHVLF